MSSNDVKLFYTEKILSNLIKFKINDLLEGRVVFEGSVVPIIS